MKTDRCVDCGHFHDNWRPYAEDEDYRCLRTATEETDPVTGRKVKRKPMPCSQERGSEGGCGPNAMYFEQRTDGVVVNTDNSPLSIKAAIIPMAILIACIVAIISMLMMQ